MILVVDNYDSFTWNLVHYLLELGSEVEVVRNDAISAGQALSSGAEAFLISPGPCTPNEAGVSLDLVNSGCLTFQSSNPGVLTVSPAGVLTVVTGGKMQRSAGWAWYEALGQVPAIL